MNEREPTPVPVSPFDGAGGGHTDPLAGPSGPCGFCTERGTGDRTNTLSL